jgi:TnpA family transposase
LKRTENIYNRLVSQMLKVHMDALKTTSAEYQAIADRILVVPANTAELMTLIGE